MTKTIMLAAGGTGGHLFPAEALAHELKARGWRVHLATDDRAGRFAGSFPADEIHAIPSATISGRNPIALGKAFWTLWKGSRQAGALIRLVKPQAVIGFGGYPTVPPMWAASQAGVPTMVHEQNAVMGRANRALANRVTAIAGGFLPDTGGKHASKTVLTGNPVRPAVLEAARTLYEPADENGPFRLLVFGGSQGAQFFSQAVPAAIALLEPALKSRLVISQQARTEDEAIARSGYMAAGVDAEIAPFFTNLAERMAQAHFVISRSGASTVSEAAVIGRPALLVPYPHALDHDQAANAEALRRAGGCEVRAQSTLDAASLADLLRKAMSEPGRLEQMAAKAKSTGKPGATQLLADLAEAIAAGKSIEDFKKGNRP